MSTEKGEWFFGYAYVRGEWRDYRCIGFKDGRIEVDGESAMNEEEIRAHFEKKGIVI